MINGTKLIIENWGKSVWFQFQHTIGICYLSWKLLDYQKSSCKLEVYYLSKISLQLFSEVHLF